jgi:hypothetical protein
MKSLSMHKNVKLMEWIAKMSLGLRSGIGDDKLPAGDGLIATWTEFVSNECEFLLDDNQSTRAGTPMISHAARRTKTWSSRSSEPCQHQDRPEKTRRPQASSTTSSRCWWALWRRRTA